MKICVMANGTSIHTENWVKMFLEAGHSVVLFSTHGASPFFRERQVEVYDLRTGSSGRNDSLKDPSTRPRRGLRQMIWRRIPKTRVIRDVAEWMVLERCAGTARRLLADLQPDLVDAHGVTSYGYIGVRCGWKPLVLWARGSDVLLKPKESWVMRRLVYYSIRRSRYIAMDSRILKEEVIRYGGAGKQIEVFSWGVDEAVFHSERRGPVRTDRCVLISTRMHTQVYNLELLIRTLPLLKAAIPQLEVVLAGDGVLRNALEQLTRELGVGSCVRFVGFLPQEQLATHLRDADIYLSTSLSDSSPSSLREAMACGVFPVVSDIPANREWIQQGENGLLVPPRDPQMWAEQIIAVFQNPSLRQDAAARNQEIVQSRGLFRQTASQALDFYEKLAGSAKLH